MRPIPVVVLELCSSTPFLGSAHEHEPFPSLLSCDLTRMLETVFDLVGEAPEQRKKRHHRDHAHQKERARMSPKALEFVGSIDERQRCFFRQKRLGWVVAGGCL